MFDEGVQSHGELSKTDFHLGGTVSEELNLGIKLLKSKRYLIEKIKPGEVKVLVVNDVFVFLRRLKDGSLKGAIYIQSKTEWLVFEL